MVFSKIRFNHVRRHSGIVSVLVLGLLLGMVSFAYANDPITKVALACPGGSRLYVKSVGSGSQDGTSWANAMGDLEDALQTARECANITEIWVAKGTYKPSRRVDINEAGGTEAREETFELRANLKLYGGFGGTETALDQRNVGANPTILSGDIGSVGSSNDNVYHLIYTKNVGSNCEVNSFIIRDANNNRDSGSPSFGGGGWYNDGVGGTSNPRIINCTFESNKASIGGALLNYTKNGDASPTIINCVFRENEGYITAGGVLNDSPQSATSNPRIVNCLFIDNTSVEKGGAMVNAGVEVSEPYGQANPTITNCTFVGNVSKLGGGIFNVGTDTAKPTVSNSVFWDNQATNSAENEKQIHNENGAGSGGTISNSIVQGGIPDGMTDGGGNKFTDPKLNSDGAPTDGSPALNAGNNNATGLAGISTDITGGARIEGNTIDAGAFEGEGTLNGGGGNVGGGGNSGEFGLIIDGGFEEHTQADYNEEGSGAPWYLDIAQGEGEFTLVNGSVPGACGGTKIVKLFLQKKGTFGTFGNSNFFEVKKGKEYVASFYARGVAIQNGILPVIQARIEKKFDNTKLLWIDDYKLTSSWQKFTFKFTADEDGTFKLVFVFNIFPVDYFFDCVSITGDGSSVPVEEEEKPQIIGSPSPEGFVPNGDFGNGFDFWEQASGGKANYSINTNDFVEGDDAAQIVVNSLGESPSDVALNSGSFILTPGVSYLMSFMARTTNKDGANLQMVIQTPEGDVTALSKEYTLDKNWRRYEFGFVPGSNVSARDLQMKFFFNSATTFLIDAASIIGPINTLAAIGGNQQVTLNWSPAIGATSIKLFMKEGSGSFLEQTGLGLTSTMSTLAVKNLKNNVAYTFYLQVVGGFFPGQSNAAAATPSEEAGKSLVFNGSFELDKAFWAFDNKGGAGNFKITTESVCEGQKALQLVQSLVGSSLTSTSFNLKAGAELKLLFSARGTITGAAGSSILSVAVQSTGGQTVFKQNVTLNGEMRPFELDVPVIATEGDYRLVFVFETANTTNYLDCIQLESPLASLVAVPGDKRVNLIWKPATGASAVKLLQSINNGAFAEVLAGTLKANSSFAQVLNLVNGATYKYKLQIEGGPFAGESNEVIAAPGPNGMLNPGFEFDLLNWNNNQNGGQATFAASSAVKYEGNKSLEAKINNPASSNNRPRSISNNIPVKTGEKYVLSFWARALQAGVKVLVGLQPVNQVLGGTNAQVGETEFELTTDWGFYYVLVDVPFASDGTYQLQFSYTTAGTVYLDNVYVGTPKADAICAGGTISTLDRSSSVNVCIGNNQEDIYTFTKRNTQGERYIYMLTDEKDNLITTFPVNQNTIDLDGATAGVFKIRGLAYSGLLAANIGASVLNTSLATGCSNLSSNTITVFRDTPDGAAVSTTKDEKALKLCINKGENDTLELKNTTKSRFIYKYIVTNSNNIIVNVLEGNELLPARLGLGSFKVWGISYAGELNAPVGSNINQTKVEVGCFDLSENAITVDLDSADGANIRTQDNATFVNVCVGDTSSIRVNSTTKSKGNYAYVVTDPNDQVLLTVSNNVIQLSKVVAPVEGQIRVYGLSYNGTLATLASIKGKSVKSTSLSNECFDLSNNFITIQSFAVDRDSIRVVQGGVVSKKQLAEICGVESVKSTLRFSTKSTPKTKAKYAYLVTDTKNVILSVSDTAKVSFTNPLPAEMRVWGLSYLGELQAKVGMVADKATLSSLCFSLSTNFISVSKNSSNEVCLTTGDENELALNDFAIYPVPTGNVLFVRLEPSAKVAPQTELLVYDFAGRIVLRQMERNTVQGNNLFKLELTNLPKGVYYLQAINNGRYVRRVFTKS